MYCKKCGREIKEGINFCPYCGTSLIETKNELELDSTPQNDENDKVEVLVENNYKDKITTLVLFLTIITGIFSCLPLNIVISYVCLGLSVVLSAISAMLYIKKSSKYYFLTLLLNLILIITNICLILFVILLK